MKTLLYRIASVPVPPPIPPPARPVRPTPQVGKPEGVTVSSPALTHDKGKSLRIIVAVVVAAAVLLAIGLPCIYVWQKRAQLKTELRLLEAQIQTGFSRNDFLAQVARVRAAHLAAREVLTQNQEIGYKKIDLCLEGCATIWNRGPESEGSTWYIDYGGREVYDIYAKLFASFGIDANLLSYDQPSHLVQYNIHDCVQQMLTGITEDIEAFLHDQPCHWPK